MWPFLYCFSEIHPASPPPSHRIERVHIYAYCDASRKGRDEAFLEHSDEADKFRRVPALEEKLMPVSIP